eukprot:sb/3474486/
MRERERESERDRERESEIDREREREREIEGEKSLVMMGIRIAAGAKDSTGQTPGNNHDNTDLTPMPFYKRHPGECLRHSPGGEKIDTHPTKYKIGGTKTLSSPYFCLTIILESHDELTVHVFHSFKLFNTTLNKLV